LRQLKKKRTFLIVDLNIFKKYNSIFKILDKKNIFLINSVEKNKTDIEHFQKWVEDKVCIVNGIKEIVLRVTYEGIYNTKEDIQRIKDYIGIINTKYEHLLDNTNRLRDRSKTKRKFT
jgi:hypothetical protein